MMQIIDLTHPLTSSTPVYPGDSPFVSTPTCTIPKQGVSVHHLSLSTHTGTHIDAPSHFFVDGKHIGQISIDELVAIPTVVVDLSQLNATKGTATTGGLNPRQRITWADLEKYEGRMKEGGALALYTGWSKKWCTPEYFSHPYLTRDAAEGIAARGVKILGIDMASPDETPAEGVSGKEGFGVHETILGNGGLIVENLANVDKLLDGEWAVSFVPLYLAEGADGSPIRAYKLLTSPSLRLSVTMSYTTANPTVMPSDVVPPTNVDEAPQQAPGSGHIVHDNPHGVTGTDASPKKVTFKEQVIGHAQKTRGTVLRKPSLKEHGQDILEGKTTFAEDRIK
ncbi:hypothetical protein APHAL10511_002278 [Amanita phalloides]|nr:hypothetical protein APHAL10511_002278 [Amanita phalloides]